MDTTVVRVAVTVLSFACFVAICLWAYSKHAKKGFEEAKHLPFTEDEQTQDEQESKEKGTDNG